MRNIYYRGIGVFHLFIQVKRDIDYCCIRIEMVKQTENHIGDNCPRLQDIKGYLAENWDEIFKLGFSPYRDGIISEGRESVLDSNTNAKVYDALKRVKAKLDSYLDIEPAMYINKDYTNIRNGHKMKSNVVDFIHKNWPVKVVKKYRRWNYIEFIDRNSKRQCGWVPACRISKHIR